MCLDCHHLQWKRRKWEQKEEETKDMSFPLLLNVMKRMFVYDILMLYFTFDFENFNIYTISKHIIKIEEYIIFIWNNDYQ